jgi:hypothetical protein
MVLNLKSNIKADILWPASYQTHGRKKEKVEELFKFVASCKAKVLSTHD